jgi:hypothetical protein
MAFIENLINGNNWPQLGSITFDSSDHVRFQNGQDVSGHNYGCNRRFVIEKNINGKEGYTISIYNLDGIHPLWQDNLQMAPKQMRIVAVQGNLVELRGFGYDEKAVAMGVPVFVASYEDYGVILMIESSEIKRAQLNMFDRNISIVYFK